MAYDKANAILDFENIELDEFGESLSYICYGQSAKTICGIISKHESKQMGLKSSNYKPARNRIIIRISQGSDNGIPTITKGKDKVVFRLEPDDAKEKTLTVQNAESQHGTWLLGLI